MSLVPPFTKETASKKVKLAQDLWNTQDPDRIWRNRDTFITGQHAIRSFLVDKWSKEHNYKLRKELFAFTDNKIAVQFWYEFSDHEGVWWRCYGLEDWTFADSGLMRKRQMSGNNVQISNEERWFTEGVDVNTVDISERHW
jgi:nuclear transport factor 2 (NTF2) superfamily protein